MAHSGELMESLEETKSEAKISQKSQRDDLVRPVHKYSIENDINKLFDSIDIKNAYKALVQSENYLSDAFSKSAMKRPMRVGSSHASGIGISESASLKQALRRLCISHASEMAATKMQLSKSTPFTGISKAGSTKSLYRAVVFEANEDKGNLVQVSLVPETNASASSIGILPSLRNELKRSNVNYTAPSTDAITQKPGATETPPKDIVGRDCLYARSKLKKKLKLCNASVGISSRTKLPALDENVCHSVDVPFSSGAAKAQEGRSTISELTFVDGESSAFKSADNNPHFVRPVFRRKNIVNKRLRSDSISPSGGSSRCNSGVNTNSRDGHCGGSCWSPDSSLTKGYKENDVSPESSSLSEVVEVSTTYVVSDVNKRNYGHKTNVRSRSREKGKTSLSSKSSIGDNRSSVSSSDESVISGSSCRGYRPHMSKDLRWKAINCVEQNQGSLGWKHFKLLRKLGGGDIGNIYLSELIGTNCLFALKVMDIGLLASRSKLTRAQTEKEILQMLDHPFLPSLYRHFTTDKFSCLLMEYCPGGDLHVLRQKQLARAFSEQATRFYIAEVVLALEYLHMLGVVYRDLKPENVLVREDGHIMLTDFDLSLRCAVNLTMLKTDEHPKPMSSSPSLHASCIGPFRFPTSLHISCFNSKFLSVAAKTYKIKSEAASQARTVPELIVEPTDARSNSFVGTHEYLAPEIIKGEGHGSAVDWWTLGILLYELLYGKTPFKAQGDEDTLINIASGCLKFPETPTVSSNARDLIRCLLQKEPQKRLGFEKGSAEIKQHKFFQGLNWALIRCTTPPHLPKSYDKGSSNPGTASYNTENERSLGDYTIEEDIVLEMF